jgi:two-component system, OmpR family, KDP operon response regulator KdpE
MSADHPVVVVIEDDPQIRRFLRTGLGSHGFEVHEAENGRSGVTATENRKPELVILDLGLPDMDGVEVVKRLRAWTTLPVIVLSARITEGDKIAALDAGADDYLTKPFSLGELLARIRVALRHSNLAARQDAEGMFAVASLKVDLVHRRVHVGDQEVHLTPIEYRLLTALVRNAGKVLTHRQLLKEVWGPSHVEHNHYLRIYMANLRHKLEADPARPRFLLTEAGVGYRLADE